jgi:Protein of unknown function (DUF3307)
VSWNEIFLVLIVCHAAGDFLFQTEWQATHKRGGLGGDPERRRALIWHVTTYTLTFVPALIWLAGDVSALALAAVAVGIALPHLVQDDGRLLSVYVQSVKKCDPGPSVLLLFVDQSFHLIALFALAIVAAP